MVCIVRNRPATRVLYVYTVTHYPLLFSFRDTLDAEGQAGLHDIGRNNNHFHSLDVCMVLNSLAILLVLYKNM